VVAGTVAGAAGSEEVAIAGGAGGCKAASSALLCVAGAPLADAAADGMGAGSGAKVTELLALELPSVVAASASGASVFTGASNPRSSGESDAKAGIVVDSSTADAKIEAVIFAASVPFGMRFIEPFPFLATTSDALRWKSPGKTAPLYMAEFKLQSCFALLHHRQWCMRTGRSNMEFPYIYCYKTAADQVTPRFSQEKSLIFQICYGTARG
jgi:hypothetical protein